MAYTPTQWNTGDTITASAMNKIEQGIADGGGGAVIINDTNGTLDKTYAEIYELIESGTPCYISFTSYKSTSDLDSDYAHKVELMPIVTVYKYADAYRIYALNSIGNASQSDATYVGVIDVYTYQASLSTGYPTFLRHAYINNQYVVVSNYRAT